MTKETLNVTIHNVSTGEIVVRAMTDDEIAIFEKDKQSSQSMLQEKTQQATEKAELLAKLGITADEAALLLS